MGSAAPHIIQSWQERARAYQQLTQQWPIFTQLADRLIDLLPTPYDGIVIDLAAGAGLLSARLLQRYPSTQVYLVEPAEAMLSLAVEQLGERIMGQAQLSAEALDALSLQADAVLCSAAMHLIDEQQIFLNVARVLKPGGLFIFNLWWHSWESTAHINPGPQWRALLEQVLSELGESAALPAPSQPRIRTPGGFNQAAQQAGLDIVHTITDTDQLPLSFFLDFTTMSSDFLEDLSPSRRDVVFRTARARAIDQVVIKTTRFVLQRTS